MSYNDKSQIIRHYDMVSPYYYSLWGEHLHHGYWETGKETKEEAQLALTKHLAKVAGIKHSSKILDVGCGFGASSIYLAKYLDAKCTGVTISQSKLVWRKMRQKKKMPCVNFCLWMQKKWNLMNHLM